MTLHEGEVEQLVADRREWLHAVDLQRPVRVEQASPDDSSIRPIAHAAIKLPKRVPTNLGIRVEEEEHVGAGVPCAEVVRPSKAHIRGALDKSHVRELGFHHFAASIE